MEFFPRVADQEKPRVSHALTLFAIQIAMGAVVGFVMSFFSKNNSGMSGVMAMLSGMIYAQVAESRVPGSLANPKYRKWLAAYASLLQIVVGTPLLLLLVGTDAFATVWWLLILVFVGLVGYLVTWWGLITGAKQAAKIRAKQNG